MAKFQCNVISYVPGRAVDITVVVPSPTFPDSPDKQNPPTYQPK